MEQLTLTAIIAALAGNIWVGLIAVFLFFLWRAGPKIYEAHQSYLQSKAQEINKFSAVVEKNSNALNQISEAINSFRIAMLNTENKIISKMDEVKDELKEVIHDNKFSELKSNIIRNGGDSNGEQPKPTVSIRYEDEMVPQPTNLQKKRIPTIPPNRKPSSGSKN